MDQQRGSSSTRSSSSTSPYQGVLWKRRDVFKSRWRPRWFLLQPASGLLTYYVDDGTRTEDGVVQYDVVPRGTIYLRSCHVEIDDLLSRPEENLYAFCITPPTASEGPPCFLAATTHQERRIWVEKLSQVCRVQDADDGTSQSVASAPSVAEESSTANGSDREPTTESWEDADDGNDTLANVPEQLASHLKNVLERNLALMRESEKAHGWKLLFQNRNGVTAHERKLDSTSGRVILKCTALLNHHPKQILNLLVDASRRPDFETNIAQSERLKSYNAHTFLDYYAFRPVWPTTARDLVTAVHWRVLKHKLSTSTTETGSAVESTSRKAICVMGFSWSDAESLQLKPLNADKVRADLLVSLYLLEEVNNDDGSIASKCRVTRVLSYDSCGSLPQSITNAFLQLQAKMPSIIDQHLDQTEQTPSDRLMGAISRNGIISDIIEPLASTSQRRESFLNKENSCESRILDSNKSKMEEDSSGEELSTSWVTAWLLAPLVVWTLAPLMSIPGKELLFLCSAWFAIRTVVLAYAGHACPNKTLTGNVVDQTTFRFSIDLKGVLRYIISNKQEHENEPDAHEVSVVPIVVKAMAQAMSQIENLSCKRVHQPLLGIDGLFLRNKTTTIDVSVLSAKHYKNTADTTASDSLVTIRNAGSMSVLHISKELAVVEKGQSKSTGSIGKCLVVLASPDSDPCDVDMNVTLSPTQQRLVDVVLVVGGVSLAREQSGYNGRSAKGKKPMLSMCMTIHGPICSIGTCRAFSDQVQKMLNFPEFCDE